MADDDRVALARPTARATDLRLDTDPISLVPEPRLQVDSSTPSTPSTPLAGKHVLVVGINYAPEPTGIAPYTTGMAEHLAATAKSVTVLTGVPHYPSWSIPPAYRWRFRASEESKLPNDHGLLVRRMRHYVPATQSALTRAAYEGTFMLNAWSMRMRHAPDLIVAVTPSLGGAVAATRLAKRHNSKLLVVVQDLMAKAASQSGIRGGGKASSATAAMERYALRHADRVAVVSDAFRDQLHQYGVPDERISLLPNWTHIHSSPLTREQARQDLGWPVAPFTVVHTGNIGLKQDLGNLVEAARLMKDDDGVRFVIVGDGSQRDAVRRFGAGLPNLAFVDPLDDVDYPKALAAADVLVLNERPGVGEMSLPSKLTSYLSSGRPVLAAVGADGAAALELQKTAGAALIVEPGHPAQLASGVRKLRSDDTQCASMSTLGKRYADVALGMDAATRRMDALLQELLHTHDASPRSADHLPANSAR